MLDSGSVSPPSLLHFGRDSSVDSCSSLNTPTSQTHHSSFSSHHTGHSYRKDSALLLGSHHHHPPPFKSTHSHVLHSSSSKDGGGDNNYCYYDDDYDDHLLDPDLLFQQDCDNLVDIRPASTADNNNNNTTTTATAKAALEGAMPSPPINIADPRASSRSPQQSNLTSQLQHTSNGAVPAMQSVFGESEQGRTRQESNTNYLSSTPFGARSIPGKEFARRESNVMSGSLMGGMSWGGISMGSFIRDDVMTGTSPYNFQSPSFHSSSYLPKMEANYMKDYVCCDIHLDSMHELLQHYEEAHAQQPNQTIGRTPQEQRFPINRAANATNTAQVVQQQTQAQQQGAGQAATLQQQQQQQQQIQQQQQHNTQTFQPVPSPLFNGAIPDQISTFDNLDDMEMDDGAVTVSPQIPQTQFQPQPQFGRQQPRAPALNVNIANAFQGHNLHNSTPSTPHASQSIFGLPNNPTVSSVNTPTLSTAQSLVSPRMATPDSSTPGTPAEFDLDVSQLNNLGFDYNSLLGGNIDFSTLNLNQNGVGPATIDDPAKRLLSRQGFGNKGFPASALANDGELAKRVRENQLLNGLAGAGGFVGEEIKPFKCPVIGCEKAYKNQNGLKYHKQHGHQNQQLKENPDGTFSIVDPTTSIPYPGTLGMEKEKPYRCEVCGKRYKNLNGLKYHRQHSPPCNPELKLGAQGMPAMPNDVSGLSVNVAGAGISGLTMGY